MNGLSVDTERRVTTCLNVEKRKRRTKIRYEKIAVFRRRTWLSWIVLIAEGKAWLYKQEALVYLHLGLRSFHNRCPKVVCGKAQGSWVASGTGPTWKICGDENCSEKWPDCQKVNDAWLQGLVLLGSGLWELWQLKMWWKTWPSDLISWKASE